MTIQEYSFTILYEPAEEGGYVVTHPALPAVVTQGDTLEEARAMAADAIHQEPEFDPAVVLFWRASTGPRRR